MAAPFFVIRDTWEEAQATMRAAIRAGGDTAIQATSKQVVELIDVFSRDVAAAERKAFFEKLGARAQEAVVGRYNRQRRGPSGYRAAGQNPKMRRYAGGRMLAALENRDNIYEATAQGITFLPDMDQLDREAKQWYRLNFGAEPGFGRRPGRFDVSISNVFLFSLGFETGPSGPFRIPRGFWIEGGRPVEPGAPGSSEYYPRKAAAALGLDVSSDKAEQKATPGFFPGRAAARGITAEHFLDAGLARFAEDIRDPGEQGIGLQSLYFKFYRRGLANVRPTRPPTVGVTKFRYR
jgi:hypothetical protein